MTEQLSALPGEFLILSQTNYGDLVLAYSDDKGVQLSHLDHLDSSQRWKAELHPNGQFNLVHIKTGLMLYYDRGQGGRVKAGQRQPDNLWYLWTKDGYGDGFWYGVASANDHEQRMNLAGDGPYHTETQVVMWEYSRGAQNEAFRFVEIPHFPSDLSQGRHLVSKTHGDFVLTATTEGRARIAPRAARVDPRQLWCRVQDGRGGYLMYNLGSQSFLRRSAPQGGEVELAGLDFADTRLLWHNDAFGDGTWCGLTIFGDNEQKLTLAGNGPYNETTPLIVWEYGGGAEKESWQWVKPPTLEDAKRLMQQNAPLFRFHHAEKYWPDNPDRVLNTGRCSLMWGVVTHEFDYDKHQLDDVDQEIVTNVAGLQACVNKAARHPRAQEPGFRTFLSIPQELWSGSLKDAVVQVVIKQVHANVLDIQHHLFYPYNGPGKFRVTAGNLPEDHVEMDTCGRHTGDWEHVTMRYTPDRQREGQWALSNVYLSRHGLTVWVNDLKRLIWFQGQPLIYVARDSHAHYETSDSHYYERPWSMNLGVATAAVDLEDLAGGGPTTTLDSSKPEKQRLVEENLEGGVTPPGWYGYTGRWGPYERLLYKYELKLAMVRTVFEVHRDDPPKIGL